MLGYNEPISLNITNFIIVKGGVKMATKIGFLILFFIIIIKIFQIYFSIFIVPKMEKYIKNKKK
jgi:hypothetical protein